MGKAGCREQWGNLDHRHCVCGRPMAADPDVERCGRCTARELAEEENGHCKICGCWLGELGAPDAEWEEPADRPPGRVCAICQIDLERVVGAATGRLRALFHTERIQVGGQVTLQSELAV